MPDRRAVLLSAEKTQLRQASVGRVDVEMGPASMPDGSIVLELYIGQVLGQ